MHRKFVLRKTFRTIQQYLKKSGESEKKKSIVKMWPQQRQHEDYRGGELPHSQQHPIHPAVGFQNVQHSSGAMAVDGQHHQYQQSMQQQQHLQPLQRATPMPSSSNPRASRNMAEKQRRDNLNTNISTMATLVPTVAGSPRRLDKISILRLAAAYLRTQYTLGTGTSGFLPRRFNDFDLEQYFVDILVANEGFIIVVTTTGKIVYISRQIEQHLGHAQNDMFGQSLYNFVYSEDHEELTRNLTPGVSTNQLSITETTSTDDNSNSEGESSSTRNNDRTFLEERRSFNVRMAQRTVSRREHAQYECFNISGILRPAEACRNVEPGTERAKHHDINSTSNDIVFVGMARLVKKRITELSLFEANKEEYVTRHLVDGRIIYCDHRISVVAGYMSQEVSGVSAFAYMHGEDVMFTIMGLRQMYDRGEGFGTSCYRLKTKTGEYIYLRTHAYVEVDKDRQSFESFVCVNTSVSEEEGERLIKEMKDRYSATISNGQPMFAVEGSSDMNSGQRMISKPSVEDPLLLETAISNLLSDLASPVISDERVPASPLQDLQIAKAAMMSERFPPASIQASKIGIKTIDHSIPSAGKDKCQAIKREASVGSPASTHSQQHDNSNDFDEPRHHHSQVHSSPNRRTVAISSNVRRGDKIMPKLVNTSAARQIVLPSDITSTNGITDKEPLFHSHESESHSAYATSHGNNDCKIESFSRASSLSDEEPSNRESIDQDMSSPPSLTTTSGLSPAAFITHRGKPESMSVYVKTEKSAMFDPHANYSVKRSHDEDPSSLSNKRRRNDRDISYPLVDVPNIEEIDPASTYYGTNEQSSSVRYPQDETLNPAAVHCKVEQIQGFSSSPPGIHNIDSPGSSLQDLEVDYQQINPENVELSGYEEGQLADFQDLQGDPLLSPGLDNNPENLDDTRMDQFSNNDHAVNEELRRTHMQLANRMDMQETQLCGLERDLENSALQAQLFKPRERLTELRAEQKKNTRMLKTIQQDHHNMQVNVKQNIGV